MLGAMTTDPHAEIRAELLEVVKRFTANEIIPTAAKYDHDDVYPEALVEQMKELGLFGITVPEEYGGLGLDILTYAQIVEELAYGWMSVSGFLNTHFMGCFLIKTYGTDDQKAAPLAEDGHRRDPRRVLVERARRRQRRRRRSAPRRCATVTTTS